MSTSNQKKYFSTSEKLKLIFLLAYFVILTVERVISLVTVFSGKLFNDALDVYMTALTVVSIVGAYAFGIISAAALKRRGNLREGIFNRLAYAAGILLLGGMVHTHGTIAPIQFASYGMILVSMAIHTWCRIRENGGGLFRWLSFGYIVAFSMSIPVVYHTDIVLKNIFVPLEIIVSAGMVVLFTFMLKDFYDGDGVYGFSVAPFAAAVVGDAAVLALRWQEEINYFVLIFIGVTAVLYVVGLAVKKANAKK